MRRFVRCALRKERSQLSLGYAQSSELSRGVRAALNEFVKLPYWKNNDFRAAARTERLVDATLAAGVCHADRGFHTESSWGDTAAPALTPRDMPVLLAALFRAPGAPARSPRAIFGVASRRDLLFSANDPNGADVGVVVITCT